LFTPHYILNTANVDNNLFKKKIELNNFVLIIIYLILDFREDLSKMEYLGCCLKEALRLHSPVPFIMRQITKEVEIEGIKFPVGTRFTVHLYNLHHNPHVWEDPMEYRPDRFLPENLQQKDSFAFVPFSAGPR
jgi:cytochrome P450 family 4 subfamily B polypeptide 1/leukotriene-B4 20-monooxygenase/phylloquinone omega-hydroxylase